MKPCRGPGAQACSRRMDPAGRSASKAPGPPVLSSGAPKPSPSHHHVFSGSDPPPLTRSPGMMLGPPGTQEGPHLSYFS